MSLTRDDVQDIMRLVESSQFDELKLEIGDLKLEMRRGLVETLSPTPADTKPHVRPPVVSGAAPEKPALVADGLIDVAAPLLGTFYHAPKPGSEPFIKVGDVIDQNAAIGIIEVMKLMNSVTADVAGEVVEIVASDGKLVEYGQVLIRIKPV